MLNPMRSIMEEVFFFFDDRNEKRCILITTESSISERWLVDANACFESTGRSQ